MRRSIAIAVVVPVAVVGVVLASSGGVVAAPNDHTVVLDTGFEKVKEVSLDGTTYEVYRYDSAVPYASGYEFFAGGERVDDAEEAERVARAYAWETALNEEMDEDDVETLRDVGTTADRAGAVISTPLSAVETALGAVDAAKERERLGVSVWDVAVSAVPQLSGIETSLRTVRDELRRWDERVGEIGDDVTHVAEEAESVRAGGETEYDELPALFEDATEGLEEAEEISAGLSNDLSDAGVLAGGVADELEGVDRVGESLSSPFRSLSSSLDETASRVEGFADSAEEGREVVEATHERATTEESRLTTGWNRRQNAALLVYGTALVLVLAAVAALYGYRRRDELREVLIRRYAPKRVAREEVRLSRPGRRRRRSLPLSLRTAL